MGRVSFLHAAADARNKTVIASQCSHWRGEESRAPPVADEARRTSGSGQNSVALIPLRNLGHRNRKSVSGPLV